MTRDEAIRKAEQTDKLKQLILFVCQQASDDEQFGTVKLNKLLFNIDFGAYRRWGKAVTDAEYQAQEKGPTLRRMVPITEEMVADHDLAIRREPVHDYTRERPIALQDPDWGMFSAEEIELVKQEVAAAHGKTADEMIGLSHEYPGWKVARIGETIPYESVFAMKPRALTERERGLGLELIERARKGA